MPISADSIKRRASINSLLITLSIVTAVLAGLPLAAGIFSETFGDGASGSTAFAAAPSGHYAVFARSDADSDEILVAPASDPTDVMSLAVIERLPGYASRGAVSPDGEKLALVAVDGGAPSQPGASLLVLDLSSGDLRRVAAGIDQLQTPTWTADSSAVIATRGGDTAPGEVTVIRADAGANGETVVRSYPDVLGVYPIGMDPDGELVSVVVDTDGSHAYRDGDRVITLSRYISRDWQLSPDGSTIAFIETNLEEGVRYLPRSVNIDGSAAIQGQVLSSDVQALGVAWNPAATGGPAFGYEPGGPTPENDGVFAQTLNGGFDVPLGYSNDGSALAIQHWSGDSFANPGEPRFEILSDGERAVLTEATRFFGWSER